MPQNAFYLRTRDLLGSQKNDAKRLFSTLHPLSTVIFAIATVLAFVLLRDSRFNFHCYTQHAATPTQKSARKCSATSCAKDYKAHSPCKTTLLNHPIVSSQNVAQHRTLKPTIIKVLGISPGYCKTSTQCNKHT